MDILKKIGDKGFWNKTIIILFIIGIFKDYQLITSNCVKL
jgi:hypothetical protein